MSLTLVTGLDGSGKSTFLERIESSVSPESIAILRVPTIDSDKFIQNELLYRQCEFINLMGERADKEEIPSLKIIAMFGSMVLFNELYRELKKVNTHIYCERHPLIDTLVYAKAYLKVMHPSNLELKIAREIDKNYQEELSGILRLAHISEEESDKGLCHNLLSFLFEWFSVEENNSYARMKILFPIEEPDQIYFLDAPVEVLIERLGGGGHIEHHETLRLLQKMRPVYEKVFAEIKVSREVINSADWSEVNIVVKNIIDAHI